MLHIYYVTKYISNNWHEQSKKNLELSDCKEEIQVLNRGDIKTWMVNYTADLLEVEPSKIDTSIPFDSYGLDSSAAVGLTGDLEDRLEKNLDPTMIYDFPTIDSLTEHLSEELSNNSKSAKS